MLNLSGAKSSVSARLIRFKHGCLEEADVNSGYEDDGATVSCGHICGMNASKKQTVRDLHIGTLYILSYY